MLDRAMSFPIIKQGYYWVLMPDHPRANSSRVKLCILVLEKKLGRSLNPGEFAHHIDGDRLNDDPSNLEPSNKSAHFALHRLILPKKKREKDHTLKAKKLCANDVLQIRSMRERGWKMQEIADCFHVGRTAIHDVVYGKCWGYIQ